MACLYPDGLLIPRVSEEMKEGGWRVEKKCFNVYNQKNGYNQDPTAKLITSHQLLR